MDMSNKTVITMLAVIAALLAGIVGILVYQGNAATVSPVGQVSQVAPTGDTQKGSTAAAPAPNQQAAAPANFDPAAATKVPAGTEPEAFVKAYYEACAKGDWQTAFDHQPADKKVGSNPDAVKETITGYGVVGFKVTNATVEGDKATVTVDQETKQYGTFENTWTFVKSGKDWVLQSKAVTGMK